MSKKNKAEMDGAAAAVAEPSPVEIMETLAEDLKSENPASDVQEVTVIPSADAIVHIPLAELHASATNPRKHFDQAQIEELAANIKAVGLMEPIIVRPLRSAVVVTTSGETHELPPASREKIAASLKELGVSEEDFAAMEVNDDCGYEIVAGERRYRSHLHLNAIMNHKGEENPDYTEGYDAIACIIRDLTDAQVLEQQVSENLQREDLTPLDWANAYAAMVEQEKQKNPSGAVAEVAKRLGKSSSVVYQTMQLAKLCDEAQEALRKGYITKNHAIDCARLKPEDQLEYLCEAFGTYSNERLWEELEKGPNIVSSVRSMREWVDEVYGEQKAEEAPLAIDEERIEETAEMRSNGLAQGVGYNEDIEDEVPAPNSPRPLQHVSSNAGPSWEIAAKKLREEEKEYRRKAFVEIIRRAREAARKEKMLMTLDDLRMAATYSFCRVPSDFQVPLAKSLGWERSAGTGKYDIPNFERTAKRAIAAMNPTQCADLILACALSSGLQIPDCYKTLAHIRRSIPEEFVTTAKRYGVDLNAIRSGKLFQPMPAKKPASKSKPSAKSKPAKKPVAISRKSPAKVLKKVVAAKGRKAGAR